MERRDFDSDPYTSTPENTSESRIVNDSGSEFLVYTDTPYDESIEEIDSKRWWETVPNWVYLTNDPEILKAQIPCVKEDIEKLMKAEVKPIDYKAQIIRHELTLRVINERIRQFS
jgi:hypothetical protein